MHDPRPSTATPATARLGRLALRLLPLVALAIGGWLLARRCGTIDFGAVWPALAALPPQQWIGALACTGLSLWALGQYDVVLHRAMGTGIAPDRARAAGMRAMAISQTIGFGSITGALVRWRALPECDLWLATRLSVWVSVSFMAALGLLAGLSLLLLEGHSALAALLAIAAIAALTRITRLPGLPQLRAGTLPRLLLWTVIDTSAAGAVIWLLLPAHVEIAASAAIFAYLAALGAGLASQSPGGVGAFELVLLALMPQLAEADLIAAIIGYRVVYHAVPALIALLALIRPVAPDIPSGLTLARGAERHAALAQAPHSEWGLAHQGARILLSRDRQNGWLVRRTGGTLAVIGEPMGQPELSMLHAHASRLGLTAALYKCGPRLARAARDAGWAVERIATEAVIDTASWSADRPACRSLRRKLKAAAKSGVEITCAGDHLPLEEMARVHAEWAARSGGERGFSMGRFCPELLAHQYVVLARRDGVLVGFASFHQGRGDWTLDLMRQTAEAPDGTMMAIVVAAIEAAREAGAAKLSLAALPAMPCWIPGWLVARIAARPGCAGLEQFKRGFGPGWRPLYIAAPTRAGLLRAGVEIARAIHDPAPLGREPGLGTIELGARPVQKGRDTARRPIRLPVLRGFAPRLTDQTGPAHDRRALPTSRNP
ncbi:phosphatidylglycerol lysyltransferase domain-containing protein [Limimaricola variabilis]|uniref:phosphatidylglycerol lysyltransferase domain-containing protein n=1 Tax=Limimaricola variabilis TaxID=1492771 RepID=UPI002AC9539F|nr:phosphatidylglycerol lysyltransferase domain-containing protein [Limimaricola variabilis]WPY95444.1 phosphatidylglycerol lysyltransferase domain-containing protein [Limimaricola variabilis]